MSDESTGPYAYEPDPFRRLLSAAGLLEDMATKATEANGCVTLTLDQCRTLVRAMFDVCREDAFAKFTADGGALDSLKHLLPRDQWPALLRDVKEARARGEDIATVLEAWITTRELDRGGVPEAV